MTQALRAQAEPLAVGVLFDRDVRDVERLEHAVRFEKTTGAKITFRNANTVAKLAALAGGTP
jgi:uncharacterized protein (DUF1697 family)